MIPRNVIVAVIPQAGVGILQIFDVPVILVQCIVNQLCIVLLHAYTQQEIGCHKQRIRPRLLRKIIFRGYGVLQNVLPKAQRLGAQIFDLIHHDIPVTRILRRLIQRDAAVPHRTDVYRSVRDTKLYIFINPFFHQV